MDTKGSQTPSATNLADTPSEDGVIYIAVKGSLYGNDSYVFGLGYDEISALNAKFPGSGVGVVNGITIKAHVMKTLNALAQLGYKIISTTGEAEVTWTLQREI